MLSQEEMNIVDQVIEEILPTLDQGSIRHTLSVLQSHCKARGVRPEPHQIRARIERAGFVRRKVRAIRAPWSWVRQ